MRQVEQNRDGHQRPGGLQQGIGVFARCVVAGDHGSRGSQRHADHQVHTDRQDDDAFQLHPVEDVAKSGAQGLQPVTRLLFMDVQVHRGVALPDQHRQVCQHKQRGDAQHYPWPRPDFQHQRRHQWPEHQSALVGDLRIGQGLGVGVLPEDMRHHHFPRHDALGGQHAAQRGQHHQPMDTVEQPIQRHRHHAGQGPIHLADMQDTHR